MVECTLFMTHCLRLNLQLHAISLVRTCRISSFCTVAWQLARLLLTRRIALSLGDSWASCTGLVPSYPGCPGKEAVRWIDSIGFCTYQHRRQTDSLLSMYICVLVSVCLCAVSTRRTVWLITVSMWSWLGRQGKVSVRSWFVESLLCWREMPMTTSARYELPHRWEPADVPLLPPQLWHEQYTDDAW